MQEFLEFTLGGIAVGMISAAIALSLVLIWRGTRVLNYSQGGMAMFTTYVAWVVISHTGNYWLGFVLALASGLVLGAILERTVVRPTEGKSPLNSVIVTIGLLIFLEGLAGIIYGGQYRSFPVAFSVKGLKLGGVALGISTSDLFTAGAVLAAALALALVFRYTAVGLRLRGTAFRPDGARPPGRRGHRGRAARRRAQLRRRLSGQRPGAGVRPGGAGPGPDGPANRPVLGGRGAEGLTMTLLRHLAIAIIVALILAGVSIQLGGYRDYQMAEVAAD